MFHAQLYGMQWGPIVKDKIPILENGIYMGIAIINLHPSIFVYNSKYFSFCKIGDSQGGESEGLSSGM
jgi:hypothetical protein